MFFRIQASLRDPSKLKLLGFLVALASPFALASCGSAPKAPVVYQADSKFDAETKRVIVVSFDGMRADAVNVAGAIHLKSMEAAGAHANATSVMPSITLVNHTS